MSIITDNIYLFSMIYRVVALAVYNKSKYKQLLYRLGCCLSDSTGGQHKLLYALERRDKII